MFVIGLFVLVIVPLFILFQLIVDYLGALQKMCLHIF